MKKIVISAVHNLTETPVRLYCNAEVRGRHLPLWGLVQVAQHKLCTAYERERE